MKRLAAALFAASFLPAAPVAIAAESVAKPLRIVYPFAAGGHMDVLARIMAQRLAAAYGAAVVVDNRPGANGIIGTEIVARATPDGHTLLFTTGSHTNNVAVYRRLPFDPVRDFAPVTQIARSYGLVLVVHPDVAARTTKELIALALAQPGRLTFSSSGIGNTTHLAGEIFKSLAKVDIVHVPYKGSAGSLNDLIGRHVDMTFISTAIIQPYVKSGRVRPIAITGAVRAPVFPDVPTFQEEGLAGFDLLGWYGLWLPGRTPRPLVERMHAEMAKIIGSREVRERLEDLGLVPVASTPAEFSEFIARDIALQIKLVRGVGLQPQ